MNKAEIAGLLTRLEEAIELQCRASAAGQAQDWAESEIYKVRRIIIEAVTVQNEAVSDVDAAMKKMNESVDKLVKFLRQHR